MLCLWMTGAPWHAWIRQWMRRRKAAIWPCAHAACFHSGCLRASALENGPCSALKEGRWKQHLASVSRHLLSRSAVQHDSLELYFIHPLPIRPHSQGHSFATGSKTRAATTLINESVNCHLTNCIYLWFCWIVPSEPCRHSEYYLYDEMITSL